MRFSKLVFFMAVLLAVAAAEAQPSRCVGGCRPDGVSKPTCAYTADTTVCYTSQDTIRLAATLTMPTGSTAPVPAVVLLSGTGMQDRDCTMAGHKLFAEIADYLSSRGVAVLRTDDRGVGASGGDYSIATTADFADDALAAVAYLKTVNGIDPRRIGLMGHSEGGASATIAASQTDDVAFVVSLAGLMTDGLSSVIQQNKDIIAATAMADDDKRRYDALNEVMFRTAYEYAESAELDSMLYRRYDEWRAADTAEWERSHPGEVDHFRYSIYMYAMTAASPWYRFFIRYNPAPYLSRIHVPVLAVNGEKDVMVNCSQNLGNVRRLLAHNPDVTTLAFPGVNHLLLPCETGTQEEYRNIKCNTSPEILEAVWQWLSERLHP